MGKKMTLADLEKAMQLPEAWLRSAALGEFKQSEFGMEALLPSPPSRSAANKSSDGL